jgi:mannose-6-phosphate isomerase-like protein (cupin superfamily)
VTGVQTCALPIYGGDRTAKNIPEMDVADSNLRFEFGVGGENKANSSSWILEEWRAPKTGRAWGYYRVLHEVGNHVKLKELTVNPNTCLSMQRHQDRAEHWFVAEGIARVCGIDMASTDVEDLGQYIAHQSLHIQSNQWHQLCNSSQKHLLKVIEIQYGDTTDENDIERLG